MIFVYGYECCAFKHNIYGDQPEVLDGMPDSSDPLPPNFFLDPWCSSALVTTEAIAVEAEQSDTTEKAKDLERSVFAEDINGSL